MPFDKCGSVACNEGDDGEDSRPFESPVRLEADPEERRGKVRIGGRQKASSHHACEPSADLDGFAEKEPKKG